MLTIALNDYTAIFSLTPLGIIRYLKLVKPVDREQQMSYTFTVGLILLLLVAFSKTVPSPLICLHKNRI